MKTLGVTRLMAVAAAEPGLLRFTAEHPRGQREVEAVLLALPEPARCEGERTRTPPTAGTEGSGRVAEYVAERFREYGLETGVAATDAPRRRAPMQAEPDLLSADSIPDRPWFRHLVYAPLPWYEAETLPGVREAILAGDLARARDQAARLAAALERAGWTLAAPPP